MNDNAFVVNRLRRHPFSYRVEISHFVVDGQHQSGVTIHDIGPMDKRNAEAIIADLQWCIERLRADFEIGAE